MKALSEFKKEMRVYFNTTVDREEGETFTSWFSALLEAMKEDGKVKIINGKTYVKE